jgi:hypothetical protein
MPTFTDDELKMLTDANILRGAGEWGAAIKGASATTGHAMTADAGQTWASNVTPEELANMTIMSSPRKSWMFDCGTGNFTVANPNKPTHWSDDFAPLPVIDPSMLESRSEREDTIARIWDGRATSLSAGSPPTPARRVYVIKEIAPSGTLSVLDNWQEDFPEALINFGEWDASQNLQTWIVNVPAEYDLATLDWPANVRLELDGVPVVDWPQPTLTYTITGADLPALTGYAASTTANYCGARDSDCAGIDAYLMEPAPEPEPPKPAPSNIKPAITGLGVTAPEDHRLGGWKRVGA